MDAFSRALGTRQGRVERADGTAMFVLGELEPARRYDLRAGDCAELAQTVDVTAVTLVRVRGSVLVPRDSGAWRVALRVAGVDVAGLVCPPGRSRPLVDLAANVSRLAGVVEVAVRLTLLEGA